jgi:uncharacterized protein (TIGR00730 family)
MQLSSIGLLNLAGFSPEVVDNYEFRTVELKEKQLQHLDYVNFMQNYHPSKNLNSITEQEVTAAALRDIERVVTQLTEGYQQLVPAMPAVAIFGSARTPSHSSDYLLAETLGARLSDVGFAVLTGGGPGIMEAANKGAFRGKSLSIGLNISLPHEQHTNEFQNISLHFEHLIARKYLFMKYSCAYVVMPGGFGTLDELSEILVLLQTQKLPRVPIILVNTQFWSGLLSWFQQTLLAKKMIDAQDLTLFHLVDDIDKILEIIMNSVKKSPQQD